MRSSGSSLALLQDDLLELLPLPLGPEVGAQPLLQELEGALLPGHLQELHGPPLVGRKANDLPDNIPDEFVVLRQTLQQKYTNKNISIKRSQRSPG